MAQFNQFNNAPTPKANQAAHHHNRRRNVAFSDWCVGEDYEIIQMLGQGAYGEVAKAKVKS